MSKYGAVRTGGYASKAEHKRAQELKLMQRAGLISNLAEQVPFVLSEKCELLVGGVWKTSRARVYIADFVYLNEAGQQIVEDVKGYLTDMYRLKKHILKERCNIDITEVR